MSHAATKWAFDQPELHRDMKPSEWAVLMVLADCHNPVNGCFPSQDYICSKTNLGERAVRDQLANLRERGLIAWDAAREGQRRGSNRYRLSFEADFQPAKSAGREEAAPTGENAPSQPAESDALNRQNLPPNLVREPVKEPEERDAREKDRKKIEAAFMRMVRVWPQQRGLPTDRAFSAFASLTAEERAEAERKFPHWLALLKAQSKDHVHAPFTYFSQKLWVDVPEPAEEKPTAIVAPPFGPVWSAVRMRALLTMPPAEAPPAKGFMAALLAQDDARGRQARLTRQAAHGWPQVNRMQEAAESRRGITVAPELEALAALMEPVPVNGDLWALWLAEHEKRGWPWLPDPGQMPVVYFPVGGPDGLEAFEQAVRGNHDAGGREAAE
ncbi:helix-turn-helix domain-containing protein [Mesorhizobium sp. WSM4962]|uniref:helix-turn-helix domain-containing protein n=1 Tax=Mesorhizobium sp. WSM4962 TaxID=3038548 RepID=UPI0024169131|nr:helix-turn-helix domain-containing protein [Mesorhizobium sp. WSM4962]MDG4903192.1 helix-turn-helix domain-containing protein [Mesorhizobium sp. WSM4962]